MTDFERDVVFVVKLVREGKASDKHRIWQMIDNCRSYLGADRQRFGREVRDAIPEDTEVTDFVFNQFEKNGV